MCLKTKNNIFEKITESIPCYKYLEKGNKSEYYYFKYRKFILNKLSIDKMKRDIDHLHSGFYAINEGFHSQINDNYFFNKLFIIPKNSLIIKGYYDKPIDYSNPDGYVSNQIIYIGKNNKFNRLIARIFYGVKFEKPITKS